MNLAQNDESGNQTKQIDIEYRIICDHISARHIDVEFCPTSKLTAIALTKPLPTILFQRCRNYCGLYQVQ